MKKHQIDFTIIVAGIPAAVCITEVHRDGIEYILLDRNGCEADWIEKKLDRHELDAIVMQEYDVACDRILEIL